MDEGNSKENKRISFVCKTDVGKVRSNNEDYYDNFSSEFGEVFIVCDGMGGHSGGEIASQLATNAIKNRILNNPRKLTNPPDIIYEAIGVANKVIIDKSSEDPSLKGMGTTVVILILKDDFAYYGHVGDSRLYLSRGNIFTSLTKDHSFVQHLVDKGLITPKEAETHPRRNEITKALGISENLYPDIRQNGLKIYKGDKFLLCTDGLNTMLSDEEIAEVLRENDIDEAAEILIQRANDYGGKDNITLQIVEILEGEELTEEITMSDIKPEPIEDEKEIIFQPENETEHIEQTTKEGKAKKSILKIFYFILPTLLVLASLVLVYLILSQKNEDVKKDTSISDTTKQKDGIKTEIVKAEIINKDSIILLILNDLYTGKKNKQLYNADSIEYYGRYSKEVMNEDKFLKNISDNKIEFNTLEGNVTTKGDTAVCEYKVKFGKDKTASYQAIINFKNKPYKILQIKYVPEKKKESEPKESKERKPEEKKKEQKQLEKKEKKDESKKKKEQVNTEKKNDGKVKEYRKELNKKDSTNKEENNN